MQVSAIFVLRIILLSPYLHRGCRGETIRKKYLSNIYAYSYSLNEHVWIPSEVYSRLKVYLHIPPYFVFADSGGSVKALHMRWFAQTLPWRPCAKSLLQI